MGEQKMFLFLFLKMNWRIGFAWERNPDIEIVLNFFPFVLNVLIKQTQIDAFKAWFRSLPGRIERGYKKFANNELTLYFVIGFGFVIHEQTKLFKYFGGWGLLLDIVLSLPIWMLLMRVCMKSVQMDEWRSIAYEGRDMLRSIVDEVEREEKARKEQYEHDKNIQAQ